MSNGHTKILNFQAQKLIEFSAADVRSLSTRREGSISISLKMSENVLWSFNSVQIGMLRVGPFSSGVAEVRRKSRAIFGLENVSFCTPLWKLYRGHLRSVDQWKLSIWVRGVRQLVKIAAYVWGHNLHIDYMQFGFNLWTFSLLCIFFFFEIPNRPLVILRRISANPWPKLALL